MPSALTAELAGAVRDEVAADHALARAKARRQGARRRTLAAVAQLRSAGVPISSAATIVARELGLRPDVTCRRRIAARLRDRIYREAVEHADVNLPGPPALAAAAPLPSSEQTEEAMAAKLIRKTTVTLEFLEDGKGPKASKDDVRDLELEAGLEGLGDVEGLEDVDDDEDDDEAPAPRRRARRSR